MNHLVISFKHDLYQKSHISGHLLRWPPLVYLLGGFPAKITVYALFIYIYIIYVVLANSTHTTLCYTTPGIHTWSLFHSLDHKNAGLARTIYLQCIYDILAGIWSNVQSYMAYIPIQFWPTQHKCDDIISCARTTLCVYVLIRHRHTISCSRSHAHTGNSYIDMATQSHAHDHMLTHATAT